MSSPTGRIRGTLREGRGDLHPFGSVRALDPAHLAQIIRAPYPGTSERNMRKVPLTNARRQLGGTLSGYNL
jgi:hypothetical protein